MLKKKKIRKKSIIIISVVVLIIMSVIAFSIKNKSTGDTDLFPDFIVEKKSIPNIIEVSGHLQPRLEQEIRSPIDGIVASVNVKEGEFVKKGDVIASMDTSNVEYQLEQTRYTLDQERFLGNNRKINLIKTQIKALQKHLDNLVITAQFDGVISLLDMRSNDVLTVGKSYGRLVDVSSFISDVEISEQDIPKIKKGQVVDFSFPVLPEIHVTGIVRARSVEAKINDEKLTVLDAQLFIENPPKELLSYYSFTAQIDAGEDIELLILDVAALDYKEGDPFVHVRLEDGTIEERAVKVEGYSSKYVQIISGLEENEKIVNPINIVKDEGEE